MTKISINLSDEFGHSILPVEITLSRSSIVITPLENATTTGIPSVMVEFRKDAFQLWGWDCDPEQENPYHIILCDNPEKMGAIKEEV